MAFDFPNAPTVGATYTSGGVTYTWDGTAWKGGPIADAGMYVAKAGDTMSGNLTIDPPSGNPQLVLDKPASGQSAQIVGQLNGARRWQMGMGNGTAEAGANAGSDFTLARYDDSGTLIDTPFLIERKTGLVTANVAMPSVLAHRSGAGDTALTQSAWTKINLGTISSGINVGGWSLSAQQGITVPKAGVYLVMAQVDIQTPATANFALLAGFGLNSFAAPARNGRIYHSVANNVSYNIGVTGMVACAAGDVLYLIAYSAGASCLAKDFATDTFLAATLVAAT